MKNIVNIGVIGVGGGGSNMIYNLVSKYYTPKIEYYIANTDIQAMPQKEKITNIYLGKDISKGLGTGMNPEVGRKCAESSKEEIEDMLYNVDLLFVSACLGGGTGTGAGPYIAELAKKTNALLVCIITLPFSFEGKKRMNLANKALSEFEKHCDSLIVVENNKLLSIIDKKVGIKRAFNQIDDILSESVIGTTDLILSIGDNDINVDFADLKTVMSFKGRVLIGIGYSNKNSKEALKEALNFPLIKEIDKSIAKGVLVNFEINSNFPLLEIGEIMEEIEKEVSKDSLIIFGTTTNNELSEAEIKITLILTGIEKTEEKKRRVLFLNDFDIKRVSNY